MARYVDARYVEDTTINTKDEFGHPVTVTRSFVNRGHKGTETVATARHTKSGAQFAHVAGPDALAKMLEALGIVVMVAIAVFAIGGLVYYLSQFTVV